MYYFFYSLNSNNFHHLIIWALTTNNNNTKWWSSINDPKSTINRSILVCSPCTQLKIHENFNVSFKPEGLLCDCQLEGVIFFWANQYYIRNNWIKIIRSIHTFIEWMNEFISNWDLGHKQDKRSIIGIPKVGLADKYLFYQWNQFNFFFE